jgi:LacI family transcriptional regulator
MKIQEIAKLAGVSTATVSRVFSHHPNIKKELREHVYAIAAQYGYTPRFSRKQKNALIIAPRKQPYPVQAYVEMVTTELIEVLSLHEYRIEIIPGDNWERLSSIPFCGVISIGVEPPENWDERFASPFILIDQSLQKSPASVIQVRSDESQGMLLAIKHLHDCRCRRIGVIINGTKNTGNVNLRREAVLSALQKYYSNVDLRQVKVLSQELFVEEIGKLLQLGIDGLFCCGGSNAGGAAAYALSLFNKKIPDDIQLVSSERSQISCFCIPPQTTITQNYTALAESAVMALEHAVTGDKQASEVILPYELIIRDSTCLQVD